MLSAARVIEPRPSSTRTGERTAGVVGDRLRGPAVAIAAALPMLALAGPARAGWTLAGSQPGAGFGSAIAAAGDVNDDGYGDVVVGEPGFADGAPGEGRVSLFLGSRDGLAASAAWTFASGQADAHLGAAVAGVGDVDGDGFGDFAAGAPGYDGGAADEGQVVVWFGGPEGVSARAPWTVHPNAAGAHFGAAVAAAGDVDGDGLADLLVGAPDQGGGRGRASLFRGARPEPLGSPAWFVEGASGERLGRAVEPAGDVDGDGLSDIIVAGAAWAVYLGPLDPTDLGPAWSSDAPLFAQGDVDASGLVDLGPARAIGDFNGDGYADVVAPGPEGGARVAIYAGSPGAGGLLADPIVAGDCDCDDAGARVLAPAGDVDGDGFGDVLVGAPDAAGGLGVIALWRGRSSGLAHTPDWTQAGFWNGERAGDVDGDGFDDVVLGSHTHDHGALPAVGHVAVFLGGRAGLADNPQLELEGDPGEGLGWPSMAAGDVDGDGFADVLVPSLHAAADAGASDVGRVELFWGSGGGLRGRGSVRPPWTRAGTVGGDLLGVSVAGLGDVDGDGLAELAWGAVAPASTGRVEVMRFASLGPGHAADWVVVGPGPEAEVHDVAGVGDLDGDGFADFSLSSPNGVATPLRFGGPGLAIREGDGTPASPNVEPLRVAAGDVDGDGRGDLLVGDGPAHLRRGTVEVYRGDAPRGVGDRLWRFVGDQQIGSRLGRRAETAGDLDADGFADVVVAAPLFDAADISAGRVYVFRGGPAGPSEEPDWVQSGVRPWDAYGEWVASAGDVDGDGFSDVLIGATGGPVDTAPVGRVELFRGNGGLGFGAAFAPAVRARGLAAAGAIAPWGRSDAPAGFALMAEGRGPFGAQRVALEAEVKPAAVPFDATGRVRSAYVEAGAQAAPLELPIASLAPDTAYHWRARLRYDPAQAPVQGWSHWVYGGLPGQPASVHLRTAVNHAPEVHDETYAVQAGLGLAQGPVGGLLANDRDPDFGDALAATKVSDPRRGTLTHFGADGSFIYQASDEAGEDAFVYRVTDRHGRSATATAHLVVEPVGVCRGTSVAQCRRGLVIVRVATAAGPRALRCAVVSDAAGPRLRCDTDANGDADLGAAGCASRP